MSPTRIALTVLFVLVAVGVFAGGHYYLWRRLVRDTALRRRVRWAAAGVLALGVLLFILAMLMGPAGWIPRSRLIAIAGFVWLGFLFYLLLFVGLWDLGRVAVKGVRWARGRFAPTAPAARGTVEPNPARRLFLQRAAAGVAIGGGVTLTGLGLRSAFSDIVTPEVPIKLSRLPRTLSGTRIVMLTDMHLGPVLQADFTRAVVEQANRLEPDLVVITGDLVDGPVDVLWGDVAPLARLRSRYGTFFVTGNHEFYSGVAPWIAHLPRLGIRVLANERVAIGDRRGRGPSFDLAGIHDRQGARWYDEKHKPDIVSAVRGRDTERELVVLAHQPIQVDDAARVGAGLQLSGHTHGGQMWPFGGLVALTQPYLSGLHRHTRQTQIYVSRGTGFWGPPLRLAAPAEITQIILVS